MARRESASDAAHTPGANRRGSWRARKVPGWLGVSALIVAVGLVAALVVLGVGMFSRRAAPPEKPLSQLQADLGAGRVAVLELNDATTIAQVTLKGAPEGSVSYTVAYPRTYTPDLTRLAIATGAKVSSTPLPADSSLLITLLQLLPVLLLLGVLGWYATRRGGILGNLAYAGSKTDIPDVTFADVAGCDEVVDELKEVVGFLRDPEQFTKLGARVPRGVLLTGPPGCGKTLLAKAVAGEGGVPFLALSGSDFVEVFAGLGPGRMRRLFADARKAGKAIVFIDEIDAVGRTRAGTAGHGGTEERESTLNQLLVELDGFREDQAVFVLAATNRPDVLDPALRRAGRFDRTIEVPPPDRVGRAKILAAASRGVRLAPDADLDAIARRTPGMTGADLANVVNQAALVAVRRTHAAVTTDDLAEAIGIVAIGPERRSRVMSERDRRIIAYHEAGHSVAALCSDDAEDPVQVTIVPRGAAGGVTWLPASDDDLLSLHQARAELVVTLGGRAAEELVFDGDVTHGAAGDLRTATNLARRLVTEFGMSEFGLGVIDHDELRFGGHAPDVHAAVGSLLDSAMQTARRLLRDHRDLLDAIAQALLVDETLDAERLTALRAASSAGRTAPVGSDDVEVSVDVATDDPATGVAAGEAAAAVGAPTRPEGADAPD